MSLGRLKSMGRRQMYRSSLSRVKSQIARCRSSSRRNQLKLGGGNELAISVFPGVPSTLHLLISLAWVVRKERAELMTGYWLVSVQEPLQIDG